VAASGENWRVPPPTGLIPDDSLRLFLIDDHSLYRAVLRQAFEEERGIEIVGESGTGSGSLERVLQTSAHVVLVDLTLPDSDGIDVCRSIVANSNARCVVLTSFHGSEADLVRAGEAGASAYVVKGGSIADLVGSIRSLASGGDLPATPLCGVHRYP
jgi:two-component system, NarL family, response regulator DevR